MKMGTFSTTVGIKPHGRRIVPLRMCFRFAGDELNGIADLAAWAERNRVKLVDQAFQRWI